MKQKLLSTMLSSVVVAGSLFIGNGVVGATDVNAEMNHVNVQKEWNEMANVPIFVKEKFLTKETKANVSNAVKYLESNKNKTGIPQPAESLKVKEVKTDELGMTHIRFQQVVDEVPVEGSELIVHYNQEDEIVLVNGQFNPDADETTIETTATVDSEYALKIAKSAVTAPLELSYEPTNELVVYPFDGETNLAYKINLTFLGDEPGNWFVFVDANTGDVIDKYNALLHAEEVKNKYHQSVGKGVHGELRKLNTTKEIKRGEGTVFKLVDESIEGLEGIYTFDHNTNEIFENNSASWKTDYQRAAVDAHYNSTTVYDYFLEEHDRNSLDDNGMPIISYVHYGNNYNNAFWNGRNMTYGDGDGIFMVPLSAGLDVAAHEMTHGVISHTANLQYRFQPGALNESFADVFGALVDEENWEIGEDIMAPAAKEEGRTALRSLSNPSKFEVSAERAPYGNGRYPEHMDDFYEMPRNVDNGGVHVNSSIPNHAAYLIGEEIGREKLGQIYYRALTVYLTPTSDFEEARRVIIQSAVDLYGEGSEEAAAVARGFDQVGIY